jgi:hypothetical protein
MPSFDITEKRLRINIFKAGLAYYFKHFFDDSELFKELEPFYEKQRYRFKMPTVGERNKVMKFLDMKGYDPTLIEDPALYTVEINKLKLEYISKVECCILFQGIFQHYRAKLSGTEILQTSPELPHCSSCCRHNYYIIHTYSPNFYI